jgi:hypothetical protein
MPAVFSVSTVINGQLNALEREEESANIRVMLEALLGILQAYGTQNQKLRCMQIMFAHTKNDHERNVHKASDAPSEMLILLRVLKHYFPDEYQLVGAEYSNSYVSTHYPIR